MSAAARLVVQLREGNLFPVEGVELADPGSLEDLFREGDDHGARALAVEVLILQDDRVPFIVKQLDGGDELQVRAVDGQQLAAGDIFAVHLGEARDDGVAKGKFLAGLSLLVRRADDELAGGNAGRRGHADHAVADVLDVRDGDAAREYDLTDVAEAGAVDGHRLVRHDLRREERLDAQGSRVRVDDFLGGTGRDGAHEGEGQHVSEICKYLLHN